MDQVDNFLFDFFFFFFFGHSNFFFSGFDFMGDKLFCTYVDKLISFYLNEEPILSSIPTFSLGEGDTKSLTNAIFHNPAVQERVFSFLFSFLFDCLKNC